MPSLVLGYEYWWDETLGRDEATLFDDTLSYFEEDSGSLLLNDLIGTSNDKFYSTSGVRTLDDIDLSQVGTITSSNISWTATTPINTNVAIEVCLSLDNKLTWSDWVDATSDSPIPYLTTGLDVSNGWLRIRQILTTTDTTITPSLDTFNIEINSDTPLNQKEEWDMDFNLLAKFLGDLEAGNITNKGLQIERFAIKRRKIDELNSYTLGYQEFVNDKQFNYTDYTQGIGEYVYSVVPVGENGLEGLPNSVSVDSDFTGYIVVDKENNKSLAFDTFIGSNPSVDVQVNKSRVQIDKLTRYPSFFYTGQNYKTLRIQAVFLPEEYERSGHQFARILEEYADTNKPYLIKASTGEIYICEISEVVKSSPLNVYRGYDYMTLSMNLTEIMSYDEYIQLYE